MSASPNQSRPSNWFNRITLGLFVAVAIGGMVSIFFNNSKVLASIQFGISAVGLLANIVQLKPDLLTGIRPPLSGISGRLLRVVPIVLLIASVFLQSVILYQLSHTPSKAPTSLTSTPTPSPLSPVQVPFVVYAGHGDVNNHYFPSNPSKTGDNNVMFNDDWTDNPHQGTTCMQVVYEGPKREGPNKWAGFELLDPSDNWGTISNTGYNLSRASRLSFWVRGNSGGERIAFQMGGVGYDDNGNRVAPYADSVLLQNPGVITLTTQWQQETIDLTGKDLTHVIGGFSWSATLSDDPNGATFYLDDIVYLA